jgi:hypothetical protein
VRCQPQPVKRQRSVDTELERVTALALVTARIPPFAELYADDGSQAAAIAAVAGPAREIDEALQYLWHLYPDRLVEAGYVDVSGAENARVVGGEVMGSDSLLQDVRSWPSYQQGLATPVGEAHLGEPFVSPTAGVEVIAVTVPVEVDGQVRAYVELELSTAAIDRALRSNVDKRITMAVRNHAGIPLSDSRNSLSASVGVLPPGLSSAGSWRYQVSPVQSTAGSGSDLYVVAQAQAPSVLALILDPTQGLVLLLATLLLVIGFGSLRRGYKEAALHLEAEQRGRAEAELRSRIDVLTGVFNRRRAMATIESELARSSRQNSSLGLLMFDVDTSSG